MGNENRFQCQQMEDSSWVPRDTYEKVMLKLDALAAENNELKRENRRLRDEISNHASLGGVTINM